MPDQTICPADKLILHRFTVENRTGEPVDLSYVDRLTTQPGRLWIEPGAAAIIDGAPADLKWLNVPESPPPMLSLEVADAINAKRGSDDAPWRGLTCRMDKIPVTAVLGPDHAGVGQ